MEWSCHYFPFILAISKHKGKASFEKEWYGLLQNPNKCRRKRGNRQELFLEYTKARNCLYSSLWWMMNQHNIHLLIIANKYWLSALRQPLMRHLEMQIWTWQTRILLVSTKVDERQVPGEATILKSCEEVGYKQLQDCLRKWNHFVPRFVFAFLLLLIQLYLFKKWYLAGKREILNMRPRITATALVYTIWALTGAAMWAFDEMRQNFGYLSTSNKRERRAWQ